MAEYIEREAAIKAMEKADYTAISSDADDCKADYLREIIESVPAADVVPVVHGEWLLRHEGHGHYWECSACHKNPCIYVTKDTNYCPNCGAKMDGGTVDG